MNKLVTIGMTALMAAGFAGAQDDVVMVGQAPANNASGTEVTGEIALVSAYVWRGQVLPGPVARRNRQAVQFWWPRSVDHSRCDTYSRWLCRTS